MNRHLLELQLILIQSRWGRIDEKWKFILQGNSCRHPIKHSPPFRGQTHANMATPYCLFFTSRTQIHCYKTAPLETTIRRFFKKWPIQTKLHGDKSKWNKELLTVKDAWLRLAAAFSPSVKEQIIVFNIIKKCSVTMGYSASSARLRHLEPPKSIIPQRPTESYRIVMVKWRASWNYSHFTLMYLLLLLFAWAKKVRARC